MRKLESDQVDQGNLPFNWGGFFTGNINYHITYHWDNNAQKVQVTGVQLNITRNEPGKRGGGFWDDIAVVEPDAVLPTESGTFFTRDGDLSGTTGDSLWNNVKDQIGDKLLGMFTQNNKTEQYDIKYNTSNMQPYYATEENGQWILLRTLGRLNEAADGSGASTYDEGKVVWARENLGVSVSLPSMPTRKTSSVSYHYNVTLLMVLN